MKLAFALMMMTAPLGTGSAALAAGQGLSPPPGFTIVDRTGPGADRSLIDDEKDEGSGWLWFGLDDDETCGVGDDDGGDDEEGEDGCTAGAAGNAAKAGTAPPPKNGLFTGGTAPVVKSN